MTITHQYYGYKVFIDSVEIASRYYRNTINPIITMVAEYPDVVSTHRLAPGDFGFVVWVEWSEGDSYGMHQNYRAEPMGLFRDYDSACALQQYITKHNHVALQSNQPKEYMVTTPDGQTFSLPHIPWLNEYRVRLEGVHLVVIYVK